MFVFLWFRVPFFWAALALCLCVVFPWRVPPRPWPQDARFRVSGLGFRVCSKPHEQFVIAYDKPLSFSHKTFTKGRARGHNECNDLHPEDFGLVFGMGFRDIGIVQGLGFGFLGLSVKGF